MIFISLSPNTEKDDIALAFSLLFKPHLWQDGGAVRELEFCFQQWLPARYALAFNSGRACLYAILKTLNLQKTDEVLLQAYTCVAVADPIIWAGAKPVYVDCAESDFNMSLVDLKKKISRRSKVLIIQHTFGCPSQIKELLEIAKDHKLFVIEDCAHCLGAEYNSKLLGAFGEASFFSFGRDKVISSVFGGMVVTNNQAIAAELKKIQLSMPYPSRNWVARNLLHPLVFSWGKKSYNFFNLGKAALALLKRIKLIPLAVSPAEKQAKKPYFIGKKMPNALAVLARQQFDKLSRFNRHRQKIAEVYDKELTGLPHIILPEIAPGRIYLRYTVRVAQPRSLIKKAQKYGIELGCWYDKPVAPHDVNQEKVFYKAGSCPVAECLAKESLNLPTNIQTSPEDGLKVARFIKENVPNR